MASLAAPPHVAPEHVGSFDFNTDPAMRQCPFAAVARLHDGPRAFWNLDTPRFGGSWVFTRAEDIRLILNRHDLFSNKGETGFAQLLGQDLDLIPLETDPPAHGKFRELLNPLMSPPRIRAMEQGVEQRALALIEAVRPAGGCEFMAAFGVPFPVGIFMQLMGLPSDQMAQFLRWEYQLLHAPDMAERVTGALAIRDYLVDLAAARRTRPTGDLTSFVVGARIDGALLGDDDVLGILYLLFVGGLDTVTSSLGFFFRHLAEHPEDQARLRAEPALIGRAVEELLRRYSVVTTYRRARSDVEVAGMAIKAGDWITISHALASLDPLEFDAPMTVSFDRPSIRHLGFSFGPHFCLGNHLARRELQIALRAWLTRIPQWRIRPGSTVLAHGGAVFGVDNLEIEW